MTKLGKTPLMLHHMHGNLHADNQNIEPQGNVNSNSMNFVNQNPEGQNVTDENTTAVTDRSVTIPEQNQPNKSNCISCRSQMIIKELEDRIQNPPGENVAEFFRKGTTLGGSFGNCNCGAAMGNGMAVFIVLIIIASIVVIYFLVLLFSAILWKATELVIFLNTRKDPQKLAAAKLVDNFIQHLYSNISETESIKLNCNLKQLNKLMLDTEIINSLNKFKKSFNKLHSSRGLESFDTIIANKDLVKDLTSQLFTNFFVKLDKIVDNESQDRLKQLKLQYLNSFFNADTGVIIPNKCNFLEYILPLQPVTNKHFLDAISDGIKQYIADNNL